MRQTNYCEPNRLEQTVEESATMTLWEKLTNDPDCGPRIRSPLPAGIIGLGLMITTIQSVFNGAIPIGRGADSSALLWSERPEAFALFCIVNLVLAFGTLRYSRNQFLGHGSQ